MSHIGFRILMTFLSPIAYGLTNNSTQNPEGTNYFQFLWMIWTDELD